ncbi:excinuclease ABC subunit UvrC [Candidatus Phytoplasma sacchari]|uniref:UvrABC system protein C n=1 Tax=Candidatus Phytoplasma sacchari TaxID=2609813 RepID=A0ABY7M0T3_9MOLU|nr:excinuclease ABC subunit UvrC [Candidatus Phytoplasma sacchari]
MILEKINNLPNDPGCYLFKNEKKSVIYIGKAKNLKNRIKNYFLNNQHNQKTIILLKEIFYLSYIITNNELEAFILEANLIKKYAPKFNLKLTDDKTFPYIEITKEKHPRLKISRYKEIPKNKIIFGPFPNNKESIKETLRIIYKFYPLRRCHPILKKPCFYYHINQCLGPCCNQKIDYSKNIKSIIDLFKSKNKEIFIKIKRLMYEASKNLDFEKAQEYKDIFFHLKKITEKQLINLKKDKSYDIVALYYDKNEISLCILKLNEGNILDQNKVIFSYVGFAINNIITYLNFYYEKKIKPKEIVLGEEFKEEKQNIQKLLKTNICIPIKGVKKNLYKLALKNAKENLLKYSLINKDESQIIQESLNELSIFFEKEINHIEVFDNSHLFGQSFVSSMIVFKNLQFDKKSYRKFNLKKEFQNEYKSFQNIIQRRYERLIKENTQLPDLILVDGGKNQFNFSFKILKKMNLNIPLGALKKNKKHQLESLVLNNKIINLDKNSKLFLFLLKISSEIHRFTVKFHRKVKKKLDKKTSLLEIKGLGKKRYQKLLERFDNLESIKKASYEDFKKIKVPCEILDKIKNDKNI